jgi:glutaminyl-peptide cyclotransferase
MAASVMARCLSLACAALALAACVSAETPSGAAGQTRSNSSPQAPVFNAARAFADLEAVVAIGPRPAGSSGAAKTRDYIKKEMAAIGLTATEQSFDADTPAGRVRMSNVSVTIPGESKNRLVVGGHYDTKLFKEITFVGANDAGSSTAFLIEFARALKDRKNTVTIELVFFDGEEAVGEWETGNTWGSRHYVDAARKDGSLQQVKAMVLVDMIAEKEPTFRRESLSTAWLKDIIWGSARKLNRREFAAEELEVSDDHVPFLNAGIPAVDIIDIEYPHWHQASDTVDKVSPAGLQAVGDVLLAALPAIELRIK